jgi:ATP-binding cassette subfamily G (WHITE) protein 2 (PDR)
MGATGAGKTTLLDVLANRTSVGVVTGEVCINGQQRDAAFQRKTGFVGQQDLHLGTATVRETLQFSALLRQPSTTPRHEKLSCVEEVLKMLEMEAFAEAIVGAPGDGLNVEQRRRLSIAVELAAKPELLIFLDEPTSGLDSQTAWNICSLLRKLVNQGQAILCTIHQPSSQLLEILDQLLLIEEGGKTLYFGEVGFGARTVISYFEGKGAHSCQSHENPAEWMFDVTSRVDGKICWSKQWQKSNEREEIRRQISKIRATSHLQPITKSTANQFSTSFFTQFQVLAKRTFTEYWRTPSYLWAKLMFCCGASLVIGFSCYKAPSTIQGLQTQLFAIFLLCTNFSNIMQQIIPAFVVRRSLFEARERPSRTYSWQAFLLSTIVTEAVWQLVMSVFTFLLFYYPIGMYNGIFGVEQAERGALMFLLFCAFFIFTSTLSHLLIAGFEDAETAVNIGQLVFYLVLIFCGVLVQKDSLPRFWIFMYRVSPLTYLVAGMFAAGVANKEIVCSRVELLSFNSPANTTCGEYLNPFIDLAGGTLVNPESTSICQYCPLARTNDLLTILGIDYTERWMYFGIMFVYIVFNVLATFLIYYLARVPRRQISTLPVIKRYKV